MRPLKHTLYTGLLAMLCLPPFLVRHTVEGVEPFPAVLMPTGATLLKFRNSPLARYESIELHGIRSGTTDWARIPVAAFLYPIPSNCLPALARRGFNLESDPYAEVSPRAFPEYEWKVKLATVSPEERRHAIAWLNARLEATGFKPGRLALRVVERTVDLEQGTVVDEKTRILKEDVLALD